MGLFSRKTKALGGFLISGHVSTWLVGTEYYPDAYQGAKDHQRVHVELVAEKDNPHDPGAIAGLVNGKVAGHLPRDVAAKYREPIEQASELGFRLFVECEFSERQKKGEARIGLGWLDIPRQDAITRWLALPAEDRVRGFDFQMTASLNTPHSMGHPIQLG